MDATAHKFHPFGDYQPNRLWIGQAFLFEDPSGECILIVIRSDGAGFLENHRPMIILFIHEVNRATGKFSPRRQHRPMNTQAVHTLAPELGQQCRVDVYDPTFEELVDTQQSQVTA